jgi:hypothetical protein
VTTPTASSLAFTPTDDTYVQMDLPSSNFGSASEIVADNSTVKNFPLRFSLSGVDTGEVTSAKLRLYCVDGSDGSGGQFYRAASTAWNQSTVTWQTAPSADPTLLASLGPVSSGRWYEVDLTSLVTGDGTTACGSALPRLTEPITSRRSERAESPAARRDRALAGHLPRPRRSYPSFPSGSRLRTDHMPPLALVIRHTSPTSPWIGKARSSSSASPGASEPVATVRCGTVAS